MTDEMKTSKLVKDVKSFLESWMALSEIEKAQVKGYVDCLRSTTPAKSREQKTAQEERMLVLVCIGCSVVASVITTKILATHYFDIVNGYVDDICNKTKEFVQKMESTICKR